VFKFVLLFAFLTGKSLIQKQILLRFNTLKLKKR